MRTLARFALTLSLCSLAGLVAARPAFALTQDQDPAQVVDVPLRSSRLVVLPGVTQVVVVEDAVCRAELAPEGIRFFGLLRGDSVVFAWIGEKRVTLLVRVEPPPPLLVRPSLSRERMAQLGQGQVATNAQMAVDSTRRSTYFFQHGFDWSQQVDGSRLSVRGQARHTTTPGVPLNVDTLSVTYARPGISFTFLDFSLNLNGGAPARLTSYSPLSSFTFRGADLSLTRGSSEFEVFAGTSIPSYYRSFKGTNRAAGVNYNHKLSPRLFFHSTTAGISVPREARVDDGPARQVSVLHTSGLTYRPNDRWAGQVTGGASSRGLYGDTTVALTGKRLAAWAAVTASSPQFSLNQLQVLSGGGTSVRANGTWRGDSRVAMALFYQHSTTRATRLFSSFAGRADYINPSINFVVSPSQSFSLNGVYSRSRGGLALQGQILTRSLDFAWTAQLLSRFVNTAQVSAIASEDPQQPDGGVRFSVRESLGVRLKGGYLNFNFQHSQQDPSRVARLRQQLGLLSPSLQELFLVDPVAFVESPNLPSEVRDLLHSLRSANSQFSVSGQFQIAQRLNLSASYSLMTNTLTTDQRATTNAFGYVLSYQLAPSLQLRSSLSDTYFLDANQRDIIRTTTFQLGLNLTFQGGPAWLAPSKQDHRIDGRVYIDRNISGTADETEQGVAGISVQLDDGRRVMTDAAGRFRFSGLKVGTYRVSMPLAQFVDPVRVTSVTDVAVDLFERPQATVDFGIVNFSRVWGSAYNDYGHEGVRRADSPGMDKVALIVTDGAGMTRRVVTDGSGDYRIDDLRPGVYRLAVDPDTIPPNFMNLAEPATFEVKPVRTVVVDVPLRALRSVAGHVYVNEPSAEQQGEPRLVPAVGVTVVAGPSQATTDVNGYFVLRNLPAGDLTVTLRPDRPLPPGMSAPVGAVRMPKEPIAVEGAVIVIRSPGLLDYLVPRKGTGPVRGPKQSSD